MPCQIQYPTLAYAPAKRMIEVVQIEKRLIFIAIGFYFIVNTYFEWGSVDRGRVARENNSELLPITIDILKRIYDNTPWRSLP